jgi:integrase
VALTDPQIKALKPRAVRYLVSDKEGLYIEVLPSGKRSWIFRYRLKGKPEKVVLGSYPDMSLKCAHEERKKSAGLVASGKSPLQLRKLERQKLTEETTLKEFGEKYFAEVIEKRWKDPSNIRRWLDNDIYPTLGSNGLKEITPADVQVLVFRKRDHGFESAAAKMRGVLNGLFDYAIACHLLVTNPVASLPLRFVTTARARTRALAPHEIRIYLQTLYRSNVRRQFKVALHLILLTLVRKSELLLARWEEFNFEDSAWEIPAERTKNGKPHVVYLTTQTTALFLELKELAGDSELVLPGRSNLRKPFAENALNKALEGLNFGIAPFTIHDLRRTASTLLHEKGFPSDVIEKSLNHTIGGIRGVYNKAEYADQRRKMLQFWADYVDGLMNERKVIVGAFGVA